MVARRRASRGSRGRLGVEAADRELNARSDLEHEVHFAEPAEELCGPRDVTFKIPRPGRHLPKVGGEDQHLAAPPGLGQPPRHAPERLGDSGSRVGRQRSAPSAKPGLEGMAPGALALTHRRPEMFWVGLRYKPRDVDPIADEPYLEGPAERGFLCPPAAGAEHGVRGTRELRGR